MDAKTIKKALLQQKKLKLPSNLYYKTQIEFAYNTNHMEGSTITKDETRSIYETGTILTDNNKVIVIKDVTETQNHFTLFNYMLDTIDKPLDEDMIKKFHYLLKNGTVSEEDKETIMVGEYKKLVNCVRDITTSNPKNVSRDIKELLEWYKGIDKKSIEDIIEFHVRFEKIHPFQDGNGRVGRMIMFRECLSNDIIPFYIEDRNKSFYIRGINKYQTNNEKGYLIDTCLNSQDNYEKIAKHFLENEDM